MHKKKMLDEWKRRGNKKAVVQAEVFRDSGDLYVMSDDWHSTVRTYWHGVARYQSSLQKFDLGGKRYRHDVLPRQFPGYGAWVLDMCPLFQNDNPETSQAPKA